MKCQWQKDYADGVRVKVRTHPGDRQNHLKVARVVDQSHYVKIMFRHGRTKFVKLDQLEIL